MCPPNTACFDGFDNHWRERLNIAASAGGQRDVDDARKQLVQSVTCPHCRARIPTSKEEAFQYDLKNAKRGLAYAQYDLAIDYQDGIGTQKELG
jgi:TPR repeat protein